MHTACPYQLNLHDVIKFKFYKETALNSNCVFLVGKIVMFCSIKHQKLKLTGTNSKRDS